MANCFVVTTKDARSSARTGEIVTPHGVVPTPCFMPIGTLGTVKHVSSQELRALGADIMLANTYHLMLRPGSAYLAAHGGLHQFNGWDAPLLTDSGGFQVFSLGSRHTQRGGTGLVYLSEEGVQFRSHLDGSAHLLTPELALDHQQNMGSDIAMVLDVCPPQPCDAATMREALMLTTLWAKRSIVHAQRIGFRDHGRLLFGIVQGGSDPVLRSEHATAIAELGCDGLAIGGVAVGEDKALIRQTVEYTAPLLPEDKPRYLMGLGTPDDIVHAVRSGVDMFDCVLPTRDARHGRVYQWLDRTLASTPWYRTSILSAAEHREHDEPIDPSCACVACRTTTRSYLRHCFRVGEPLAQRLATIHNLTFYLDLMRTLRKQIAGVP